jgi:nucleoside 2-deoxyribosyltransferase
MIKVYLVCPVRNCSDEVSRLLTAYVSKLEKNGYEVHYPPRDCEQNQSGIKICETHRKAMVNCDEVHFFWDPDSKGSHFDLGMAFMLEHFKPIKYVMAEEIIETPHKSYGNVIRKLS